MSTALAGRVDGALRALSARERRTLERRDRDGARYALIAAELDVTREQVADLLVGARLAIAEQVSGTAPPERRTPRCGPARRVATAQQDGEPVSARDLVRADEHFAGCEPCRAARLALQEARLACRAWSSAPPAPPARSPAAAAAPPRRRLAIAAVVALALITLVAALAGGGPEPTIPAPSAPPVREGSADAEARDVVPPPGDEFCAPGEPGCR